MRKQLIAVAWVFSLCMVMTFLVAEQAIAAIPSQYALKGPQSTVCAQCHTVRSDPGYTALHNTHVSTYMLNCNWCHTFTVDPGLPAISVSPDNQAVNQGAGTTSFSVSNYGTGTTSWTASAMTAGSWLSITSGASGSNSGMITCNYSANTTASSRTETIRITAINALNTPVNVDVTVTQAPGFASTPAPAECVATLDATLLVHIPYVSYVNPMLEVMSFWLDFVLELNSAYPTLIPFKFVNIGIITNPSFSCTASILSGDFKIHISDLLLPDGITHLWVDLAYNPTLSVNGNIFFSLINYGVVPK